MTTYYPVDVNNDPMPSFNFDNSTGSSLTPFGGTSDEQILYNLFSEMRSVNNNLENVQAFFEAMLHMGNNAGDCNNQNILQMINDVQGQDGSSISSFMGDMFAVWAFSSTGGSIPETQAYIANMLTHLGSNDSNQILGGLRQELELDMDPGNLATLTSQYTQNGALGYTDINGNWVDCTNDLALFQDHLSGVVGNWFNQSNMKDQLKDLRLNMFDEEVNNPEASKYGVFALVAILISMCEINDDESQQSGLSNNTTAQSQWTKEVSTLNSNFTPDYFTGNDAGAHAKQWIDSLNRVTDQLNNNSNASDVASSAEQPINSILNTQVTLDSPLPNGNKTGSLMDLYNEEKVSGNFSGLATQLNSLSADPSQPSSGGTPNSIIDNVTALSKALTSAGQTLTTKSNAIAQTENSMENTLSQVLTAQKKLYDAIITAITQAA